MKPEWCTQEIWERALAVQDKAIERYEAEKLAYRFPTCNGKSVLDEEVARALLEAHQRGRREGVEEAADMIDHGFEKPVGKSYHPNFRSKHDQCPHGLYMYEDCEDCCSNAIRAKAQEVSL